MMNSKVLLCVLDGFGHGPVYEGNAIANANAPFLHGLFETAPWTLLEASGEAVGIPAGTQGGSEVGHLTMGAGRVVPQPLLAINKSIESGAFFKLPALLAAAEQVKSAGSALHILGMISDQGVHADLRHAFALLLFAKEQGIAKVYVHGIADGRDVQPQTLETFVDALEAEMARLGVGVLASLVGRFYAMDRDQNWDRTAVAFDLLVSGKGKRAADAKAAILEAYAGGLESDYYLEPVLLAEEGVIKKDDAVVFFNFRTDRAAQLTEKLITELGPHFLAFGPYTTKAPVLFPAATVKNNLGAVLEANGKRQLRIGETEKYAHVTFFFNSQVKEVFAHEDRILIDSPKCASYAEKPEMSAEGITDALLAALPKGYDFVALNFANLDLVGHSGNYAATVKAVEAVDGCLARLVPAALELGYTVLITGDHGNAEYMIEDGEPCPSHTRNPVPLIVVSQLKLGMLNASHTEASAGLKDIAPSILQLMGLAIPAEMEGESQIIAPL